MTFITANDPGRTCPVKFRMNEREYRHYAPKAAGNNRERTGGYGNTTILPGTTGGSI